MSTSMLSEWINAQKARAPAMKNAPTFYRNLEEALDMRRKSHALYTIKTTLWKDGGSSTDFSSNDTLSLSSSGRLRAALDAELAQNPGLPPGAGGSRLMDGNSTYLETVEDEIASFHGAEAGLFVTSGYEANLAIFAAIPRPGDAIVYDELVHASAHDGMEKSPATTRIPFRHNDPDALREALVSVRESEPLIRQGRRCVIIAVESIYSMDGDICPLRELVEVVREMFPAGNAQFLVDEAHSTGVVGPCGAGLVSELGLEKEIAIRLHTFSKAVASGGAIILGNQTIKTALTNLARSVIYTAAPAPPVVATVRSAYRLMRTGETKAAQEKVQHLVRYFFTAMESNSVWEEATDRGIISVPLREDWERRTFQAHVCPIWTRNQYSFWLVFHLSIAGFSAFPVEYPTVPKGQSRVRLSFHAANSEEQVDRLVRSICEWAKEMMDIEDGDVGDKIPKGAKQVYALMDNEAIATA